MWRSFVVRCQKSAELESLDLGRFFAQHGTRLLSSVTIIVGLTDRRLWDVGPIDHARIHPAEWCRRI